jgi:hypothetical protein
VYWRKLRKDKVHGFEFPPQCPHEGPENFYVFPEIILTFCSHRAKISENHSQILFLL